MNKLRLAVTSLILGTALYAGLSSLQSRGKPLAVYGEASSATVTAPVPSPQYLIAVPAQDIDEQIQRWIDSLSVQKGFEAWKKAKWTRYPLGPGSHGWIVILQTSEQEELGYLVVSATQDGQLALTEYGAGASPLFSMTTLYRTLMQQELIADSYTFEQFITSPPMDIQRLYYSPLHAVWHIAADAGRQSVDYFLDAKTGEQLPLKDTSFSRWNTSEASGDSIVMTNLSGPSDLLQEVERPGFDPFHNTYWLQGKPLAIADLNQLHTALQQQDNIVYAAKLYNKQVLAPFAVIGYTLWSGSTQPFVRLEQEGSRYIPLQELLENGFFFP
ncbi:MAG: hypothetical protein K0R67_2228 [Paenibacillus sp.]|jgi:hypothetical protein|nr:hypothetical protein [Paenibacillus sp.]